MKSNISNWAVALACGILGLASPASALTISSSEYVGYIDPNQPSSPASEVTYINALIGLSLNGTTTVDSNLITRSGNAFAFTLPTVVLTGALKDDTNPSTTVSVTGFEYLLGKYDAANAGALVFYVGGLTGNQMLPATFNGHDLSHWSLYNATPSDTPGVPEGGPAVMLLGVGIVTLAFARRFVRS